MLSLPRFVNETFPSFDVKDVVWVLPLVASKASPCRPLTYAQRLRDRVNIAALRTFLTPAPDAEFMAWCGEHTAMHPLHLPPPCDLFHVHQELFQEVADFRQKGLHVGIRYPETLVSAGSVHRVGHALDQRRTVLPVLAQLFIGILDHVLELGVPVLLPVGFIFAAANLGNSPFHHPIGAYSDAPD